MACDAGGYSQLYPLAKNQNKDIWVLKLDMSRSVRTYGCKYKTELRRYSAQFILKERIVLSDSSQKVKYDNWLGLKQFESVADSLYTNAVQHLIEMEDELQFFNCIGAAGEGTDTFANFHLNREEEVTSYKSSRETDGIRRDIIEYDTLDYISSIQEENRTYNIDSLARIISDSLTFSDEDWKSTKIRGVKIYELDGIKFLVLHFDMMRPYDVRESNYATISGTAEEWVEQLYQPIGWHHGGQEILLRLE